jgi:hypothetical protein
MSWVCLRRSGAEMVRDGKRRAVPVGHALPGAWDQVAIHRVYGTHCKGHLKILYRYMKKSSS